MSLTKFIRTTREEYFIDSKNRIHGLSKFFIDDSLLEAKFFKEGVLHGLNNNLLSSRFNFYKNGIHFGQYNNTRNL